MIPNKLLLTLTTLFLGGIAATKVYEEGGKRVNVYYEPLNSTANDAESTTKCVEYIGNDGSEEFSTACFDTEYNENGVYIDCEMKYDGKACTSCTPCTSRDGEVLGFNLDCNNIIPSKTSLSFCAPIDDFSLKKYLTSEGDFSSTTFEFDSRKAVEETPEPNVKPVANNSTENSDSQQSQDIENEASNVSNEHNEYLCGDGSNCARQCEDDIAELERCFAQEGFEERPDVFGNCVNCIRPQGASDLLKDGTISGSEFEALICETRPTCEDVCEECFAEAVALTVCAWNCSPKGDTPIVEETPVPDVQPVANNSTENSDSHQSQDSETEDVAVSADQNEYLCGDGSNCARQCEEDITAIERCFAQGGEERQEAFRNCVGCIRPQDAGNMLKDGTITGPEFQARICETQPTCEDVCEECFAEAVEITVCAWNCTYPVANVTDVETPIGGSDPEEPIDEDTENPPTEDDKGTEPEDTDPPETQEIPSTPTPTEDTPATPEPTEEAPVTPEPTEESPPEPTEAVAETSGPPEETEGNVFERNNVVGNETIVVIIVGMSGRLTESQEEAFVRATEQILHEKGDDTAKVRVVDQRLDETSRRRQLQKSNLVVDAEITSLTDDTPASSSVAVLESAGDSYLELLKAEDSGTFSDVEEVRVGEETEPSTTPSPEDDSEGEEKNTMLLFVAPLLGIVGVTLLASFILLCLVRRAMVTQDADSKKKSVGTYNDNDEESNQGGDAFDTYSKDDDIREEYFCRERHNPAFSDEEDPYTKSVEERPPRRRRRNKSDDEVEPRHDRYMSGGSSIDESFITEESEDYNSEDDSYRYTKGSSIEFLEDGDSGISDEEEVKERSELSVSPVSRGVGLIPSGFFDSDDDMPPRPVRRSNSNDLAPFSYDKALEEEEQQFSGGVLA